jgi:hypothetical protein
VSRSMLSNERVCFVCKRTGHLHKHHIYGGIGRRKLSEHFGMWVYLCPEHHNMSKHGVHSDTLLDLKLKKLGQETWEFNGGSRVQFIQIFGRSYL